MYCVLNRRNIEKHQDQTHYDQPVYVQTIRISKPSEMVQLSPAPVIQPEEQGNRIRFLSLLQYENNQVVRTIISLSLL